MSNLVIVAIPDENDRVWKVSSEKIPHLTLLFLGDVGQVSNLETIIQFVEHAANTTLRRFYLPVDRRGELGADKADVLFFKKGRYDYKAIRDFRAALLQDNNIKTAYDSSSQFEGPWNPHLTLGYPAAPAKPDPTDRDYGFYDVGFTKIAVWVDDFNGPEFLLKDYWDEWDALETVPMDVAMSDIHPVDDMAQTAEMGAEFLAHFGVKGMRWGQRKTQQRQDTFNDGSPKGGGKSVTPGKIAKLDKKFEKNTSSVGTFIAIHNRAADLMNQSMGDFNGSFDKKYGAAKMNSGVLLNDHDPITKDYHAAYNKKFIEHLNTAAREQGTNASGTRRVKIHTENADSVTEFGWAPKTEKVKHAALSDLPENSKDLPDADLMFVATLDAKGRILSVKPAVDTAVAQSALEVGSGFILEHFGVKGMRWGVRNAAPPSAVAPSATSRVPHGAKSKTKIDTSGGENHPAHGDAIKVAQAQAKLKKSGAAALSNNELRDVANRLQLEQQVKQLSVGGGHKFVAGLLKSEGQQSASRVIRKQALAKGF